MNGNFEERLEKYFIKKGIYNDDLKNAIKTRLGKPADTVENILTEINSSKQSYFYDTNFESVLDLYSYIYRMDNALDIFNSVCGYCGSDTLFVTNDLSGVSVTTH